MRTLVLGATGFIGQSIARELMEHGHKVVALARTKASEAKLADEGVEVIRGNLRHPERWSGIVRKVDAIIHVAATFSDDMGDVDRHLVEVLIAEAERAQHRIRFIYTGGCWLYGVTGNKIACEESDFDPLPSFEWMIDNSSEVFAAACFEAMLIHPAMVYDRNGGAISGMLSSACESGRVEVWGSLMTRWPVVHRQDLARAYRVVLEKGEGGQSYCVSAENGVTAGEMASVIARRCGLKHEPQVLTGAEVIVKYGECARGPMLDQQMSGEKIKDTLGWVPRYKNILSEIR